MRFTETPLSGAFVIDIEKREDPRGFFARSYCADEFTAHGLESSFCQCNVSYNLERGTLRGMHFQIPPKPEGKLVRVTRGAIVDVIVDIRPASPTYCRTFSAEMTEGNRRALYIPPGFAHGFQTLSAATEVFYQMTERYVPELARGLRWNDPAFRIEWPIASPILSERDREYADFEPDRFSWATDV